MPASVISVNVTSRSTLVFGSQGSTANPVTVVNTDSTNYIWIGSAPNIMPAGTNTIPLGPGSSFTSDGSVSLYAVTNGPTVVVSLVPGNGSYSPGTVAITGPVTATISGLVTVTGNVNVSNTPNVNVSNTPSVNVANSPTVNVGTVTGSINVAAVSGNVNVNGVGGYVQPGQVASITAQGNLSGAGGGAFNIPASSTANPVSLANVSTYNSYDLSMYIGDGNQATAGHAHTVKVSLQWFDDNTSGIPVFIEDWYVWVGLAVPMSNVLGAIIASGPMHGQYLSVYMTNNGNAAVEVQWIYMFGSPRTMDLSDWRQNIRIPNIGDSVLHIAQGQDGTGYDNVLMDASFTLTASQNYMIPLNLYSGPVNLFVGSSQTITDMILQDIGATQAASGSVPTARTAGTILESVPTSVSANFSVYLPRSACALIVKNVATTTTFIIKVTAQQGP